MSELLDRIRSEIGERLEASRAAVLEYERLVAALHALSDAGSPASRAVTGRGQRARATATVRRSGSPVKPSTRARSSKQRSTRSGADKRTGAAAARAAPPRRRAPRGANRAAVLRVIGERPGVTARELAVALQVGGGTLYALLRRLADERMIEKRELPGGQAGYALAASGASAQAAGAQPDATTTTGAVAESRAEPGSERDRDDSPQTADAAQSSTGAQPTQ